MPPYPTPFAQAAFPPDPPVVAGQSRVSEKLIAHAASNIQSALRMPADALVTALWIQGVDLPDEKSQSFQNHEPARNAPIDSTPHFHFIPGVDNVEIRWNLTNIPSVKKARFEIWSAADSSKAIWFKEYNTGQVTALSGNDGTGPLPWSTVVIDGAAATFPDKCPNVAMGPYLLRLAITSMSGRQTAAWTHFDVLVAKFEIHYGPKTLIPNSMMTGAFATYWTAFTEADEKALVDDLQKTATLVPDTGQVNIELSSTQAGYITPGEWFLGRDYSFLRHRGRWGDGPRIPLIAKVFLQPLGDGAPVHSADAAKALGPAKFLWDWEDKIEADRASDLTTFGAHATAKAFVMKGLKYKENAADEPPDCLNCHADRGGKRGGTALIFPEWNSPANFPFEVTRAGTRKWASISKARTEGTYACSTGVIFQPSRMALDSYKIRVLLWRPTVDVAGKIATVLNDHPGLPCKATAMFEIYRRIMARYVRKGLRTPAIDIEMIKSMFALGGAKVICTNEFWTAAEFRARMAEAIVAAPFREDPGAVRHRRHPEAVGGRLGTITKYAATRGRRHMETFDHWSGEPASNPLPMASESNFTLPSRDVVEQPYIVTATRDFINQDRFVNKPKRQWIKFRKDFPGPTEDQLLYRFFQEKLSVKQRTTVLASVRAAYEAAGWEGWDRDRAWEYDWANDNYRYAKGLNDLSLEMEQRKLMLDNFDGVTFFHYTHFYEVVDSSGDLKTRQCDLGGLAAVTYSADLGFRGAFSVWDHPDNGQRFALMQRIGQPIDRPLKNGNYTSAHEFGHFLHLPHPKPPGTDLEQGMHDRGDTECVMNYFETSKHVCGGCALRIRGWAMFKHEGRLGFSSTDPSQEGVAPLPIRNNYHVDSETGLTTVCGAL